MKIFADTNVLASALATRGLCDELLREILAAHELFSSTGILNELERILRDKFKVPVPTVDDTIQWVQATAILAYPDQKASYAICDQDDIPHISAAETSGCTYFVTGDKELLRLTAVSSLKIVSPRELWRILMTDAE